jgi:beta-phosphoglucomutase-like phosphatase (HAD superfamily)
LRSTLPAGRSSTGGLEGVIFDFNGVLLWDSALHERAWQAMARALRGIEFSDEEFAAQVHGRPNARILAYLTGRELQPAELRDLTDAKESMYRRSCLESPDIFVLSPGAERLLDFLADAGVPRTIATASERTNLDFFVQHLHLGRWFDLDAIVFDDGSRPGKPAPDMFAFAAQRIGVPPGACIVVEDSRAGFQAAHAAQIGCVIGLGPAASHARLLASAGVTAAIESLEDFPRGMLVGRSPALPA